MRTTDTTTAARRDAKSIEGEMYLLDKPAEWSSFDVVNKMRGILRVKKIGHAGTLDRLATGLLIVCTGRKTKELASFQELDKEYIATFRLGERTESYDAESEVMQRTPIDGMSDDIVRRTVMGCVGEQLQLPPMWSAAKVAGKRLYKYARKGIDVQRRPRAITVYEIGIMNFALPDVTMRVRCSKGTYIRSLVHEIGEKLEVGAHVVALRRTRIGSYCVEDALSIEELVRRKVLHRNEPRFT